MRDFAEEMRIEGKQKRSRQEMINKVMCKPGYTWNETVKRCLGPAGGGDISIPENPGSQPSKGQQQPTPEQAITNEVSARAIN
jgi:hypothetical protein